MSKGKKTQQTWKDPNEAKQGNKTDLQRIGLFNELGYVTIGDRYKPPYSGFVCMLLDGRPINIQDGYFATSFDRVFTGEAFVDPVHIRHLEVLKSLRKNLHGDWKPNSFTKIPCGLGSYCGCINQSLPAFSTQIHKQKPRQPEMRNFQTSPPKNGTGYGYVGVTFGAYPAHMPDQYSQYKAINAKEVAKHKQKIAQVGRDALLFKLGMYPSPYFGPNPYDAGTIVASKKKTPVKRPFLGGIFRATFPVKKDGGMKAGTINPYPEHSYDPYRPINKPNEKAANAVVIKPRPIYYPSPGEKTRPTTSVLVKNVDRKINNLNYKLVESVMHY